MAENNLVCAVTRTPILHNQPIRVLFGLSTKKESFRPIGYFLKGICNYTTDGDITFVDKCVVTTNSHPINEAGTLLKEFLCKVNKVLGKGSEFSSLSTSELLPTLQSVNAILEKRTRQTETSVEMLVVHERVYKDIVKEINWKTSDHAYTKIAVTKAIEMIDEYMSLESTIDLMSNRALYDFLSENTPCQDVSSIESLLHNRSGVDGIVVQSLKAIAFMHFMQRHNLSMEALQTNRVFNYSMMKSLYEQMASWCLSLDTTEK